MYLRWRSRKLTRRYRFGESGSTSWRAELVESHRANGKPRQRHIASLVAFTDDRLAHEQQICFIWQDVYDRLDALKLDKAVAAHIVADVAKRVPKRNVASALLRSDGRLMPWLP